MKWVWTKRLGLGIVFVVSLLFIFFVGRNFNKETLQRERVFTTNGINNFRKGLDISGGTKLVYKINYDKYKEVYSDLEFAEVKKTIENVILKNIDGRISTLGVSDYKAYIQNLNDETQVVVEIGGVADLDQAKEMIGKTVELEFKIANDEPRNAETIAARKARAQSIRQELLAHPEQMLPIYGNQQGEDIYGNIFSGNASQLSSLYNRHLETLNTLEIGQISPLLEGVYGDKFGTGNDGLNGFLIFRVLERNIENQNYVLEELFINDTASWKVAKGNDGTPLNGAYFNLAEANADLGKPGVSITFNEKGKEIFCQITKENKGSTMGIFIWGVPATIATIQEAICDGRAQISGGFDRERAIATAKELNSGNMPAPLILMQEEQVSPSLWDSALQGALVATAVGTLAIILYMFFIYGWRKAVVTTLTMIFYFVVLLAVIKLIDYALSLSGIAAIILSIGMAVDANVLIFERMNEEIKEWKTVKSAISSAAERSWSAIRDGQVSTLLIWVLLFAYGINMFKGFGSMIVLTALLTLFLNVPFIIEALKTIYKVDRKN